MELRDFITETLVQIQEGVEEAIRRRSGHSGAINPVFGEDANAHGDKHIQKVEFDVAVTATGKLQGEAKAGLKVFAAELGGEGSLSRENSTVSHIKFTVPLIPPTNILMPNKKQ